ncbi:MAG: DUF4249 domain-containing protein [Candidatus Kapabacteria bacterium]|nr:DUF4249 domain-containing protein [Candidatus Kapabacteria bacterium]
MLLRRFFLLALVPLLFSCGQSLEQALNPAIPLDYKEQIFMEGALVAGEPIRNIRLSRTLEPTKPISRELAAISTATVRLRVNGQEYRMTLQPQRELSSTGTMLWSDARAYYQAGNIIAEEGVRYEIIAEWNGKTARVSTTVPRKPSILSVREVITTTTENRGPSNKEFRYEARFAARAGEAYQVGVLTGRDADTVSTTRNGITAGLLKTATSADSSGTITLQSQVIYQSFSNTLGLQDPQNPHAVVYSFDAPFAEYYNSYTRGFRQTDPFTVGGVNVRWNVQFAAHIILQAGKWKVFRVFHLQYTQRDARRKELWHSFSHSIFWSCLCRYFV